MSPNVERQLTPRQELVESTHQRLSTVLHELQEVLSVTQNSLLLKADSISRLTQEQQQQFTANVLWTKDLESLLAELTFLFQKLADLQEFIGRANYWELVVMASPGETGFLSQLEKDKNHILSWYHHLVSENVLAVFVSSPKRVKELYIDSFTLFRKLISERNIQALVRIQEIEIEQSLNLAQELLALLSAEQYTQCQEAAAVTRSSLSSDERNFLTPERVFNVYSSTPGYIKIVEIVNEYFEQHLQNLDFLLVLPYVTLFLESHIQTFFAALSQETPTSLGQYVTHRDASSPEELAQLHVIDASYQKITQRTAAAIFWQFLVNG